VRAIAVQVSLFACNIVLYVTMLFIIKLNVNEQLSVVAHVV